jgi:hypothetical protein
MREPGYRGGRSREVEMASLIDPRRRRRRSVWRRERRWSGTGAVIAYDSVHGLPALERVVLGGAGTSADGHGAGATARPARAGR